MKNRNWLSVRKGLALSVLVPAILVFSSSVACAHPLGNFSTNHFAHIEVGADRIKLRYVIDMAEIPTFQELQRLTGNGDSALSRAELDAYAARVTEQYADALLLVIDDARVPLRVLETHAKLWRVRADFRRCGSSATLLEPFRRAALKPCTACDSKIRTILIALAGAN